MGRRKGGGRLSLLSLSPTVAVFSEVLAPPLAPSVPATNPAPSGNPGPYTSVTPTPALVASAVAVVIAS